MKNSHAALLAVLLGITVTIYSYGLFLLPPEYDEVLVTNVALNCPSNVFNEHIVWIHGYCFPIMLSSYIGGALAIPYQVLFSFISPSVQSFRIFNLLLLFSSFYLIYVAARKYFSKEVGLITVFLLAFDFQVFYSARLERTMIVPFFLKSLFLFVSAKYFQEKKTSIWLILSGGIAGLSVWTKFDAVFFYAPLLLASLFDSVYRRKLQVIKVSRVLTFTLGFFIGILPLLYYLRSSLHRFIFIGKEVAGGSFLSMFETKLKNSFFQLFSYDAIAYIVREPIVFSIGEYILACFVFAFILYTIFVSYRKRKLRILLLTSALFYIAYFLYDGLKFTHHRILLYPVPQLLLANAVLLVRREIRIFVLGVFILIFSSSLTRFYTHIQTKKIDASFSKHIYPLARYVSDLEGIVLIGDWGITNQLLLLSPNRTAIREIAFAVNTSSVDDFSSEVIRELGGCNYLVLRNSEVAIFKRADENLRSALRGSLVYTDQVFEVYTCAFE